MSGASKTDVPYACSKMGIPVIVTSEQLFTILRTERTIDNIVKDLLNGTTGVLIR